MAVVSGNSVTHTLGTQPGEMAGSLCLALSVYQPPAQSSAKESCAPVPLARGKSAGNSSQYLEEERGKCLQMSLTPKASQTGLDLAVTVTAPAVGSWSGGFQKKLFELGANLARVLFLRCVLNCRSAFKNVRKMAVRVMALWNIAAFWDVVPLILPMLC